MATIIIGITLSIATIAIAVGATIWSLVAAARGLGGQDDDMTARREERETRKLAEKWRSGQ